MIFSKQFPKQNSTERENIFTSIYYMSGNVLNGIDVLTQSSRELHELGVIIIPSAANEETKIQQDSEKLQLIEDWDEVEYLSV